MSLIDGLAGRNCSNMPRCTMPKIPWFRKWYNEQFKDICEAHDKAYSGGMPRKDADIELLIGIVQSGYVSIGVFSYILVRFFGYFHYKKIQ